MVLPLLVVTGVACLAVGTFTVGTLSTGGALFDDVCGDALFNVVEGQFMFACVCIMVVVCCGFAGKVGIIAAFSGGLRRWRRLRLYVPPSCVCTQYDRGSSACCTTVPGLL